MSDDSFFREVDEELRQDKVKAVWTRFGAWLLGGAVLVVAVTAGTVAYEHYRTTQANAAGDRFAAAIALADDGKSDAAIKALNGIADAGVGAYPALARLAIGGIEAKAGRPKEAVAAYDSVANEDDAPKSLRDMASIRAAYVLVDTGTLDEVRQRVERLTGDSDPLRFPAREAIALAAWKAGDVKTAKPLFDQLVTDPGTPRDISGRARILLDLINSGATGPNALPPAENDGKAPPAAGDNGLGVVDLPGLLDGTGGAGGTASNGSGANAGPEVGGAAMPTTGLGVSTGAAAPEASGAAAPSAPGAATGTTSEATPSPTGAAGTAAPADSAAGTPASTTPTAPAAVSPDAGGATDAPAALAPTAETPATGEAPESSAPPEAASGGGSSSAPAGTNSDTAAPATTAAPSTSDTGEQPAPPAANGGETTTQPNGN